jgi:3-hydroxyisobutyrate dehydrogenase-like beta-hydroxyacid dehydrogenase
MGCNGAAERRAVHNMKVGFLHPGEMGSALGHGVRLNGHVTCWASDGRSGATRRRAADPGWVDLGTVDVLAAQCDVLVSICPPQAAPGVAQSVARAGFGGLYIDANPLAPGHMLALQATLARGGARVVDAAIVGPPPVPGAVQPSVLLVSGPDRDEAAACLCRAPLVPMDLGEAVGQASALKLCHSALHKGLLALQVSTWALASRQGLLPALDTLLMAREATAHHVRARPEGLRRARPKADRFAEEMDEWALACAEQGLDASLGAGAADAFRRLAALLGPRDGPLPTADDEAFWASIAIDGGPHPAPGPGPRP